MNIDKWIILLSVLLVLGCGQTSPTPPVAIPAPPEKTESVRPSFDKVKKGIDESVESNEKFDEKLREQTEVVNIQNVEIKEALLQAERIKEKVLAQQAISEIEALNLVEQLTKVQTRNLFLEKSISELEKIRRDQLLLLHKAREDARETELKLILKEDETNKLRSHSQFLATNLQQKNNEVLTLQKALEKEKIKSAKAATYRNWLFGLCGFFVLWTIVKNIISIYSPIKFRI